jgi:hypothetical protein
MKLGRLDANAQHPSRDAVERVRHVADEVVWHVGAIEGIDADRRRSLQQEIAEIEQKAIGDFEGGDLILADAKAVAEQVSRLGGEVLHLVKPAALDSGFYRVDDKA